MTKPAKFREVLKDLDATVTETLGFFEELDPSDLPTLLKAFAHLKDNRDKLVMLEKLISELYQKLSYETIPNAFEVSGFDSIKLAGRNFILSTRVNASIPEDKREFGYRWITDVAKVPELIRETVNPKQLASFATAYFEANGAWPPEEAMNVHKQPYIQVRKA